MTGTTLANLRTMLKAEIGDALSVSTADHAALTALLNNAQKKIAAEYSWPHMETRANVAVSTQTASLPTTAINFDRGVRVSVKWNGTWHNLGFGVGEGEYNAYDTDETSDPIRRWRFYGAGSFEVWPIPATEQTVRFIGSAKFTDMSVDADTCAYDDLALVYLVAAERLTQYGQKQAQLAWAKYNDRVRQIRQNYPVRNNYVVFGSPGVRARYRYVTSAGSGGEAASGLVTADSTLITADSSITVDQQ